MPTTIGKLGELVCLAFVMGALAACNDMQENLAVRSLNSEQVRQTDDHVLCRVNVSMWNTPLVDAEVHRRGLACDNMVDNDMAANNAAIYAADDEDGGGSGGTGGKKKTQNTKKSGETKKPVSQMTRQPNHSKNVGPAPTQRKRNTSLSISRRAAEANRLRGRSVSTFSPAERKHWREGSWHQELRHGRLRWWWVVNGVWYSYADATYPYPDEASDDTDIDDEAADDQSNSDADSEVE